MSESEAPPVEELLGYRLIDRLGQGGYGEVWRAEAPGGLNKAVKFVFGRQDDTRAAREMKAMERVREVRHPFLLSLERIDLVEGRLVVISELADGSLRDRFYDCLDSGLPGIPRDELLRYMRESADALDFLRDTHRLQHLDVKPENILLLAGHVKVADFGLVKSIGGATESLVGGMTPTYAGPEVFRGSPGEASDQYSLAILYQELLTGQLPFGGQSTAELTFQHLNDEPHLAPLCEEDRYAVSRALAKEPSHRYASCSDFVRALETTLNEEAPPPEPAPVLKVTQNHGRPGVASQNTLNTQAVDALSEAAWNGPSAPILFEVGPPAACELQPLGPEAVPPATIDPTPSLFLGIGGGSGRVLRALREKVSHEFDLTGPLASMPFLLIDTDPQALNIATRGGDRGTGLLSTETVALPLKRPQQYREKSDRLLGWLSRRWLYNIPKSLRTEGIRPLGRLALVDHARQCFQRIRHAVIEATSPESIEASNEATGLTFRPGAMRVYLVASLSGGASSGMLYDVAYAVRTILQRAEIELTQQIGLLCYSTSRNELARVNAFSALAELRHFNSPDAVYPGDPGAGLPQNDAGVKPFDATYVLNFGSGPTDPVGVQATGELVDYLYLDALTPAQCWFDGCRAAEPDSRRRSSVRGFRVEQFCGPKRIAATERLCKQLFASWTSGHPDPDADTAADRPDSEDERSTNHLVHGAVQFVGGLRLDAAGLVAHAKAPPPAGDGDEPQSIEGQLAAEIGLWLAEKMNAPGERLLEARRAALWLVDHFEVVARDLLRSQEPAEGSEPDSEEHAAVRRAAEVAQTLIAATKKMLGRIDNFAKLFREETGASEPIEPGADLWSAEVVTRFDATLQAEFLDSSGGVARVLAEPVLRARLTGVAQKLADRVVAREIEPNQDEDDTPAESAVSRDPTEFGGCERRLEIRPTILDSPGLSRAKVVECEGISIPHLAAEIVGRRQDYARFADRVHARTDIEWSPLLQSDPGPPPLAAASAPAPSLVGAPCVPSE